MAIAPTPTAPPGVAAVAAPKKPVSGGLFGKPKPAADVQKTMADLAGELNNISRRLMILEERYTNLRKKTQVTDQNMLAHNKELKTEIQTTNSDIEELRKEITEISDKMRAVVRELKECAKKQEVELIKKYVSIWEPIKFVTRESVVKLIKDEVEAQIKDLHIKLQEEEYVKEQIKLALKEMRELGELK